MLHLPEAAGRYLNSSTVFCFCSLFFPQQFVALPHRNAKKFLILAEFFKFLQKMFVTFISLILATISKIKILTIANISNT